MSAPSLVERDGRFELQLGRGLFGLIVLAVALVGGGLALALALATGAVHTTTRAETVIESAPPAVSAAAGAPWSAVYARTAPGTVDLTVSSQTSLNTPFGPTQEQATATGTGFVIDGQGRILTAAHVVADASSIKVAFQGGLTRTAKVLGEDDSSDVALLRVDPVGLTLRPVRLGSSRSLSVGAVIGVIGDPLGFDRSLSTGVVSGLDRTIEAPSGFLIAHAVQTDAALNPGNSGGPLLDARGRVVGIADQIATNTDQFGRSTSQTTSGLGFAVPIDLAKVELPQLERGQHVTHAYLGVSTAGVTSGGEQGALVEAVQAGTPAARAGLHAGDVIVSFNGATIRTANELIDALAAARAGERIKLRVLRGSSRKTFTVTLAKQPAQAPSQ